MNANKDNNFNYEIIFDYIPDTIIIVNEEGNIVKTNRSIQNMFGYTKEDLYGKPVETLIPIRFRENHKKFRMRYFSNPRIRPMGIGLDLYGLRKDGIEFPADIMLTPLYLNLYIENKNPRKFFLAVVRDITEKKKLSDDLRKANYDLEVKVKEITSELNANEIFLTDLKARCKTFDTTTEKTKSTDEHAK